MKKEPYHEITSTLSEIDSGHADDTISVAAYVLIKSPVVVVFLWQHLRIGEYDE